jgi:hypothetical protein
MMMARFKVLIDDHFHYMDEDSRYQQTVFETAEEATAACRKIVDSALQQQYEPGLSASALYHRYMQFGEDPFILTIDGAGAHSEFSARDYAKARSTAMCNAAGTAGNERGRS